MIGLGSNRLSVCRRGGMSVTQAGKGGMEWLAGGRWPRWASPYSAAATAALLAQFPTQWPTILDYGFAHPEIVGYMNAYAPEDAKIAYSLVEGIGTRWLVGDGSSYIITSIKPGNTTKFKTKMKVNGGSEFYFGGRSSYGSNMFALHPGYAQFGTDTGSMTTIPDYNVHVIELSQAGFVVDGVTKKTYATQTFTSPNYFAFFNCLQGSGTPYSSSARCQFAYGDFDTQGYYIPFMRNNVMYMIDLKTGDLGTNVGTFTELIDSPS